MGSCNAIRQSVLVDGSVKILISGNRLEQRLHGTGDLGCVSQRMIKIFRQTVSFVRSLGSSLGLM